MTAPKKPQDRKPKQPVVKKVDGGVEVTLRGITLTVETAAVNDYELLELAASGEMSAVPRVVQMLLGVEQANAVKELLRNPDTGRIPLQGDDSMTEFLQEMFGAINPNS